MGSAERARQVMRLLGEGRLDDLIPLSHPDVEWHSFFAHLGEGGVYRGHKGMEHYVRDLPEAWEFVRAEVDDSVEVGSGVEMSQPAGWMLKLRDGKVILFRAFRDPETVLEAVGLGS